MAGPVAIPPIAVTIAVNGAEISATVAGAGAAGGVAAAITAAINAAVAAAAEGMAAVNAAVSAAVAGLTAGVIAIAFIAIVGTTALILVLLPKRSLTLTLINQSGLGTMTATFYHVHGTQTATSTPIAGGQMGAFTFEGDGISGTAGVLQVSCDSIKGGELWIAFRIPEVDAKTMSACGVTLSPGKQTPQEYYNVVNGLHNYKDSSTSGSLTACAQLVQETDQNNPNAFTLTVGLYSTNS